MSRNLSLSLAAALLVTSHAATAQMGLSTTCSKDPPAPSGHIVAKVIAAKTLSNGKVQLTLDKGDAAGVDADDDVHLLSCDGKAIQHASADVFSTTTALSYSIARFPTDKLVGAYAAIDTGKNSAAPPSAGVPAGHKTGTVTAMNRVGNQTEVMFTVGVVDGLMPGDKGYIATESGSKYTVGASAGDLTVTRVGEKHAWALTSLNTDSVNRSTRMIFVKPSKSSCTIAKADMSSGNASSFLFLGAAVKKDGDGNPLVVKFDDSGRWQYRVVAQGGGSWNNVLPGTKAYVVNNGTLLTADVKVTAVAEKTVEATVTSDKEIKFTHLRAAQSSCK